MKLYINVLFLIPLRRIYKVDVNDSSNIQLYQEIKKNDHVIRETFLEKKKNGKTEERRRRWIKNCFFPRNVYCSFFRLWTHRHIPEYHCFLPKLSNTKDARHNSILVHRYLYTIELLICGSNWAQKILNFPQEKK